MKVLVVGMGGVGGYFGGILARHLLAGPGHEVTFVARGAHLEAIRENGLTLQTPRGTFQIRPTRAVEDPRDAGPVDLVLLCVKTYDLDEAAAGLGSSAVEGTLVLPLQNGVAHRERVAAALPRALVCDACVYVVSSIAAPGVVLQQGSVAELAFGDGEKEPSERLLSLARLFDQAGIQGRVSPEIASVVWTKFLFICPFGSVTSLLNKTVGEVLADPEGRRLVRSIQDEILSVAAGSGVHLPPGAVDATLELAGRLPFDTRPTLQRDLQAGRRNELDALCGEVARRARVQGSEAPVSERIYRELRLRSRSETSNA